MAADLLKEARGVLDLGYVHNTPLAFDILSRSQAPGLTLTSIKSSDASSPQLLTPTAVALRYPLLKNFTLGVRGIPGKPVALDCKYEVLPWLGLTGKMTLPAPLDDKTPEGTTPSKALPEDVGAGVLVKFDGGSGSGEVNLAKRSLIFGASRWRKFGPIEAGMGVQSLKTSPDAPAKVHVGVGLAQRQLRFPWVASLLMNSIKKNGPETIQLDLHTKVSCCGAGANGREPLELALRLSKGLQGETPAPLVGVIGLSTVLDKLTSTVAKAKLSTARIATLAVSRKIADAVICGAGVEFDLTQPKGSEKFGVKLALSV